MTHQFYAIRQRSTGFFMPSFPGRAGGTHMEPSETQPPRLFRRAQDAKAALDWWLKGKIRAHYDYEGEFTDIDTMKVPERLADDMEIVLVQIIVYDGSTT